MYLLDIPMPQKGYKVLNLATQKIHITRDVTFHETLFPFAMTNDATRFPSSPFNSITFTYYPMSINNNENSSPFGQHDQVLVNDDGQSLSSHFLPVNPSASSTIDIEQTGNTSSQHVPSILTQHPSPADATGPFMPSLRKSPKTQKVPSYLSDYVHTLTSPTTLSLNTLFSLIRHISSHVVSPDSNSFVMNASNDCEPNTLEEADIDPAWRHAMT